VGDSVLDDVGDVVIGEAVEHTASAALRDHQPGLSQQAQLVAHGALLDPGDALELAGAALPGSGQLAQGTQANRVG
jgi:hypothetical protein